MIPEIHSKKKVQRDDVLSKSLCKGGISPYDGSSPSRDRPGELHVTQQKTLLKTDVSIEKVKRTRKRTKEYWYSWSGEFIS